MQKFLSRRFLPMFLCIAILFSIFAMPASANFLSDVAVFLNETTFFRNVTEQKLKSALLNFFKGTTEKPIIYSKSNEKNSKYIPVILLDINEETLYCVLSTDFGG